MYFQPEQKLLKRPQALRFRPAFLWAFLFLSLFLPASWALAAARPGPMSLALKGLDAEFLAADGFSSHLPVIIFEPAGDLSYTQAEIAGELTLLDSSRSGLSRLGDHPAATLTVLLTRLDQSAGPEAKSRFRVELAGGRPELSLLGLPARKRWLLEGSEADPAMLRNYLAYTLGGEIMDGQAPRTRLCEVFFKVEKGLLYQGLHLFSETPADGLGATEAKGGFVFKYAPSARAEAGRRLLVLPGGHYELVEAGPAEKNLKEGEEEIARAQRIINSPEPDIYFNYKVILETRSALNTYILNELLMNHQAGGLPVYVYKAEGRKLKISPVWNFDHALDNSVAPLPDSARDAARTLWLPGLFKSREFVNEYRGRYYLLFRRYLNPDRLNELVDETTDHLGPALIRDWQRWEKAYGPEGPNRPAPAKAQDGTPVIRGAESYDQEIIKIKYLIREQDLKIRADILQRPWRTDLIDGSARIWRGAILSVFFMAVFFATVSFARKRY